MQYLLLIYANETAVAARPKELAETTARDYMTLTQDIVKSGHFRAGERLGPVATATTVRTTNGKTVVSDGPFAETKEQLGGYYLVDCKDLDEALGIAARIPAARLGGSVEVRPIIAPTMPAAR